MSNCIMWYGLCKGAMQYGGATKAQVQVSLLPAT